MGLKGFKRVKKGLKWFKRFPSGWNGFKGGHKSLKQFTGEVGLKGLKAFKEI